MTNTQKMLRGIEAYTFATVKPKIERRLKSRPGYRDRFLTKQAKNLAAADECSAMANRITKDPVTASAPAAGGE